MKSLGIKQPLHVKMLRKIMEDSSLKNPLYSLRAFAKRMGMHPSAMSRILAGKQALSVKSSIDILNKLDLDIEAKCDFIESVSDEKAQRTTIAMEVGTESECETIDVAGHPKVDTGV